MDHPTQVALLHKLFALIDQRQTQMSDAVFLNPVSCYTSGPWLAREQAQLFTSRPLLMGLSTQLLAPGDFLTDDLGSVPVVLVRDLDGRLNAFINVCRHRGARLVEGKGSGARALICPYHGWSYDLQGQLRCLSPANGFTGLTCEQRSLIPLAVTERHGLIWVNPAPGSEIQAADLLGPLDQEVANYGFGSFAHYETRQVQCAFNWKIVIETFLENLHFSFVHQKSILSIFMPGVSQFEGFADHGRLIMPRRSVLELRSKPQEEWDLLQHSVIIYLIYPNTLLLWQGDHLETWRAFPVADHPDRCVAEISLFSPVAATSTSHKRYWDKNMELAIKTVVDEDFAISRGIQKGFVAQGQQHLTFGRMEPALQHFHGWIQRHLSST